MLKGLGGNVKSELHELRIVHLLSMRMSVSAPLCCLGTLKGLLNILEEMAEPIRIYRGTDLSQSVWSQRGRTGRQCSFIHHIFGTPEAVLINVCNIHSLFYSCKTYRFISSGI